MLMVTRLLGVADEQAYVGRSNPRQHLGFGWGPQLCIGAPLARLEARVTFGQLLARNRSITLDPDAEIRHHPSLMVRRLTRLPLLLEPAS